MNLKNCKSFDNYSNFIYSYGLATTNIEHCHFTRCGGPIAILAHEEPNYYADRYGTLNIDANSTLVNYVTGGEAWFNLFGGAGLVNKVKPLSSGLNAASKLVGEAAGISLNKSFVRIRPGTENSGSPVEEINLIAVIIKFLVFSEAILGEKKRRELA